MSSQTLLTPSIISKESLVILENNLVAAGKVNRQFENQFVKIGGDYYRVVGLVRETSTIDKRPQTAASAVEGKIDGFVAPRPPAILNKNIGWLFRDRNKEASRCLVGFLN